MSTPVSRENAQPGDLIFFTGTYSAGTPVTHVGIYIGNGQMLRDSFQTALLNELHSKIGDSFKKLKASVYADHKNGFYVRAIFWLCDNAKLYMDFQWYLCERWKCHRNGRYVRRRD